MTLSVFSDAVITQTRVHHRNESDRGLGAEVSSRGHGTRPGTEQTRAV